MLKRTLFLWIAFVVAAGFIWQAPSDSDVFKNEFLTRINAMRAKGCQCGTTYMPPTQPLTWNSQLAESAAGHAYDMDKNNYFSHTSKNGRTSQDRMLAAGYTYQGYKSFAVGENIAKGQQSIAQVSDGWFKSPGHCHNLMNPDFKEIGIAQYNRTWVQDFGGRESFSAEEQRLIKSGRLRIIMKKTAE